MTFPRFPAAVAALVLTFAAAGARGDEAPPSLLALFNRLPDLPATAQDAARWVDRQGRLVHPGLLALKADLQAHRRLVDGVSAAAAERGQAQSGVVVDGLGKGLGEMGIDMARMQRDPAYAQQIQDRLRRMSPQEAIAFSQRMVQPLNRDPRHQNAAQAMVDDAPAVQAAAQAGEAYGQARLARLQGLDAIWREADQAAEAIRRRPLSVPAAKPAREWDHIGCDSGCRAQWDAYAAQALPLLIERDSAILQARRGALQKQRAALADGIRTADRHLVAVRYGAASQSGVHQMQITGYDGAVVADLAYLIERITDSVRSAAVVVHCGKQAVQVPQAVCS